jgi:hypothetical protein
VQPNIIQFAETARSFCSWCEAADADRSDVMAAFWLSQLHSCALLLPETEIDSAAAAPDVPDELRALARVNLSRFDGRYYRVVFDPDPTLDDEEPVMGDLGDDLRDIYKDVRRGLLRFDSGHVNDAVWEWRFNHIVHWGHHATSALYALHHLTIAKHELW